MAVYSVDRDTPVHGLAPLNGKTDTGRLWTYVWDDQSSEDMTASPSDSESKLAADGYVDDGLKGRGEEKFEKRSP